MSGISDILAKYISLADWKIAHLVSGEYYCPMVADLAQEALTIMRTIFASIKSSEISRTVAVNSTFVSHL